MKEVNIISPLFSPKKSRHRETKDSVGLEQWRRALSRFAFLTWQSSCSLGPAHPSVTPSQGWASETLRWESCFSPFETKMAFETKVACFSPFETKINQIFILMSRSLLVLEAGALRTIWIQVSLEDTGVNSWFIPGGFLIQTCIHPSSLLPNMASGTWD